MKEIIDPKARDARVKARPFAKERWRAVLGFDGYEVSDLGRVRSWRRPGRAKTRRAIPLIRKAVEDDDGYMNVIMSRNKKVFLRKVHHLVLEAFRRERRPGEECRHRNGDPGCNRLSNLSWGTHLQNFEDQVRHGTDTRGCRNGGAKLGLVELGLIRDMLARNVKGSHLAVAFDVSQATISRIKHGERYGSDN